MRRYRKPRPGPSVKRLTWREWSHPTETFWYGFRASPSFRCLDSRGKRSRSRIGDPQVRSGEQADDPRYLPAIARVRQALGQHRLLYGGDCKMAALPPRAAVAAAQDQDLGTLLLRTGDDDIGRVPFPENRRQQHSPRPSKVDRRLKVVFELTAGPGGALVRSSHHAPRNPEEFHVNVMGAIGVGGYLTGREDEELATIGLKAMDLQTARSRRGAAA